MPSKFRHLQIAAKKWLRLYPQGHDKSGYVVVFNCEGCGWTRDLGMPEKWCPGAYAVGHDGTIHEATGGHIDSGAKRWVQVWPQTTTANRSFMNTKEETFSASIDALPDGPGKALLQLVWLCRQNVGTTGADHVRLYLISAYGGQRSVNISDICYVPPEARVLLLEFLGGLHTEVYDHQVRDACKACGLGRWFAAGFPRGKAPDMN